MRKTAFSIKNICLAGVLIAMSIVLSRFVSIPVGATLRISIAAVPIFLAGLWLGPILGGICGLAADLIGCMIAGYSPNPLITLSSLLWGILPAVLIPFFRKTIFRAMKRSAGLYACVFTALFLTMLCTSLGTTTLGLTVYAGTAFVPLFLSRIPQTLLLWIADSLLVCLLYERIRL